MDKKNQRSDDENIKLTEKIYDKVVKHFELPKPKEQADNLIRLLGSSIKTPEDKIKIENYNSIVSKIGAANKKGLIYIIENLLDNNLVDCEPLKNARVDFSRDRYTLDGRHIGLTFKGWEEYEKIKRGEVNTQTAFMAMEFDNDELDDVYFNHLKPCVEETGFELIILKEKPKAGLIDDRLRTEIRNAEFLLVNLTNDNSGAYWEGGFGEALGKPVIYLCESEYFDKYKTHFDTNHHFTVVYDIDNMNEARKELKATIRATLPHMAKMKDD